MSWARGWSRGCSFTPQPAPLSQQMLADRVGVRRSSVILWERGMTFPRAVRAFQLARTLDTLVEALYPEFYITRGPSTRTGRSGVQ